MPILPDATPQASAQTVGHLTAYASSQVHVAVSMLLVLDIDVLPVFDTDVGHGKARIGPIGTGIGTAPRCSPRRSDLLPREASA